MPRGKKEPAEQIIPYAASVEVEVGPGKTHLRGPAATFDTSTPLPLVAEQRWKP